MPGDIEEGLSSEQASGRWSEDMEASRAAHVPPVEEPKRPLSAKELEEEKNRKALELYEEEQRHREEKKRQKELEFKRYKRKLITPGVVLVVGAIASITMFSMRFDTKRMLIWLLVVLFAAWIVGGLIHYMFDKFAEENENVVSEEGEVINKGMIPPEEES
jgi:cation transport ATPase